MSDSDYEDIHAWTVVEHCIVVSISGAIETNAIVELSQHVLRVIDSHRHRGVVFDLGNLDYMDLADFQVVRNCMQMVSIMGLPSAIAGVTPGIAAVLAENDANMTGLDFFTTIDGAIDSFDSSNSLRRSRG